MKITKGVFQNMCHNVDIEAMHCLHTFHQRLLYLRFSCVLVICKLVRHLDQAETRGHRPMTAELMRLNYSIQFYSSDFQNRYYTGIVRVFSLVSKFKNLDFRFI